MSRKLLEIAYLGTAYCGWQVQPNGITVQEILQASLHKVLKHKPAVTGCSRNTVLPDDIAALNCYDVADDFHARYSATGKMYRYSFLYSKIKNPFLFGRTLQIKSPIDIKLANEYCNLLKGTHDFEAFFSVNRTVKDTVRTVSECYVEFKNDRFDFYVKADGFLYNMVRIMVGTLLEYSSGKISSNDIKNAFITGDRTLLGATAPPQGLYLEKVFYDNNNFMILDDRS